MRRADEMTTAEAMREIRRLEAELAELRAARTATERRVWRRLEDVRSAVRSARDGAAHPSMTRREVETDVQLIGALVARMATRPEPERPELAPMAAVAINSATAARSALLVLLGREPNPPIIPRTVRRSRRHSSTNELLGSDALRWKSTDDPARLLRWAARYRVIAQRPRRLCVETCPSVPRRRALMLSAAGAMEAAAYALGVLAWRDPPGALGWVDPGVRSSD